MTLPLWFLVFALFVPRIALFCGWIHGWVQVIAQPWAGLTWFFLPRVLVLLTIVSVMGICPWFWIHLAAAVFAWGLCTYRYTQAQKGKSSEA